MSSRLNVIVIAVLVVGCGKPVGPVTRGTPSSKADPSGEPSLTAPTFTSTAKVRGRHGGTTVQLMPAKIDTEILVAEADETVIVLGVIRGELLQDLWFVAKTGDGEMATEAIRGEKRAQFGVSDSWVFQSGRLVELLTRGRDGKVILQATTQSGAQATPEFLAVEITWPAKKSDKKK